MELRGATKANDFSLHVMQQFVVEVKQDQGLHNSK